MGEARRWSVPVGGAGGARDVNFAEVREYTTDSVGTGGRGLPRSKNHGTAQDLRWMVVKVLLSPRMADSRSVPESMTVHMRHKSNAATEGLSTTSMDDSMGDGL